MPGYGYDDKLIVSASVIVAAMIFMVIFCLTVICRQGKIKKEAQGTFFNSPERVPGTQDGGEEFLEEESLWLWDMYGAINAMHKKNMAQKLHDKDSLMRISYSTK